MLYFPDKTNFLNCDNFTEKQKKNFSNHLKLNYSETNFYEVDGALKEVPLG
jgi:hypothetical protein